MTVTLNDQPNNVVVDGDVVTVAVSGVGAQGAQGIQGIQGVKGDKGDTGASGVIAVTAPITNSGTSTSATIGVSAGTTSDAGVVQLTDSTTSTSTTTAATANSVKLAVDRFEDYLNFSSTAIDVFTRSITITNVTNASGTMRITFFTATQNMTVSQITIVSGGTASSGLTLARFGLYDETTLLAQTASDTTLFNSASTAYTRSFDTAGGFPATYNLVAGTRYGVGMIVVGTTPGTVVGITQLGGIANSFVALSPRLNAQATGQTDLPASPPAGNSVFIPWARIS